MTVRGPVHGGLSATALNSFFVAASHQDPIKHKCSLSAGATEYLVKPLAKLQVMQRVLQLVARSRARVSLTEADRAREAAGILDASSGRGKAHSAAWAAPAVARLSEASASNAVEPFEAGSDDDDAKVHPVGPLALLQNELYDKPPATPLMSPAGGALGADRGDAARWARAAVDGRPTASEEAAARAEIRPAEQKRPTDLAADWRRDGHASPAPKKRSTADPGDIRRLSRQSESGSISPDSKQGNGPRGPRMSMQADRAISGERRTSLNARGPLQLDGAAPRPTGHAPPRMQACSCAQ